MQKLLFCLIVVLLIGQQILSTCQMNNASKIDTQQIRMETRARAIAAGNYDYSADTDLLIKE